MARRPGPEEVKRIVAAALVLLTIFVVSRYTASSAKMRPDNFPRTDAGTDVLFVKNCASCHGKDGRAKTFKAKFKHAQNLTNPKWQASITDEHIFISILKGKGKMPAFEKKLSENEIAALVTYVRMLKR